MRCSPSRSLRYFNYVIAKAFYPLLLILILYKIYYSS
nr:MAG TPA: hypothetical protein [Caudoviricetes sp.]